MSKSTRARTTVPISDCAEMAIGVEAKADPLPNVCQRKVVRTNPQGAKTECLFSDGTSILPSSFLASFVRADDELLFPLDLGPASAASEIYIRKSHFSSFDADQCGRWWPEWCNCVPSAV